MSTEDDKESMVINESVPSISSDLTYWSNRWKDNKIGWHINEVNPFLKKYIDLLVHPEETCVKKFFIPLSGKSKDLAYVLSKGHSVFAIEGVEKAIRELDKENNFDLIFNEEDSTFSTKDSKLIIYFGNIFDCPIEKWGPFDIIWDRGSLIAVEYSARNDYKSLIQRSLKDSTGKYVPFRYLLSVVEYNRKKFPGPPRVVDSQDLVRIYGDWTKITFLERQPLSENHPIRKIPDIGYQCDHCYFLMMPKK